MSQELPYVQAGFRIGKRNQISNCQHPLDHRKSNIIPKNIPTSVSLSMPKTLTVWITTNCGKFLERWGFQITLSVSWETCMRAKKQQLEPDMKLRTSSKLGREYVKAVYCQPAYLTYMQSISCKMLGWMKHKLESRLLWEISRTSDMQMIPL